MYGLIDGPEMSTWDPEKNPQPWAADSGPKPDIWQTLQLKDLQDDNDDDDDNGNGEQGSTV